VPHLTVNGKGDKIRYLPLDPGTNALIHDYLDAAGHGEDDNGALFWPIKNNRTKTLEQSKMVHSAASAAVRPRVTVGFGI
jgi:integrase/recombinase XerD